MNRVHIDRVTTHRRGQMETHIQVWDNEAVGEAHPLEGPDTDDRALLRQVRECGDDACLDILEAAKENHAPVHIDGSTYELDVWVAAWDEEVGVAE